MPSVRRDATCQVSRAYLDKIQQFSMLSAEQGRELVRRYRANGDRAALDQLVMSHLRLVVKVAERYRG